MQPTDKNHKSRKSLEKQPEAEAGIEFFASHAPCGGFFVAEVVRGSAQRASTRAPYLEYVVRSMGRSKHPHQLAYPVQMGRNPKHKRRSSIQGYLPNFSTYTSFIAILCIQSGFRPFTGHYSVVFFPICHGTIKCEHGTINRAPSKNIPKDSGWQSAPSPGIALMILQTPPTRPLAGRGANEPLALVLRPFRSCLLLLLALFRCLPVHLVTYLEPPL